MKEISVHLLGNPEIWAGGEKISFPYKKAEAFFYYLCVKKKVSREEVICLLWGDEDETTGKKKLRDAVYQVKRLLGKEVLFTWGHTEIALNPEFPLKTDWDEASENGEGLWGAGFLEHFYIKNCYEFEEWTQEVRRRLSEKQAQLARERLKEAAGRNDAAMLQKYGNILLSGDPYNEELYFELMNLYAQSGSYTMAIRLYSDLQKLLLEELDEKPSRRLTELFHRIYTMKEAVSCEGAMAELPFVGRKRELYRVNSFLAEEGGETDAAGPVGCLAVSGENGSGKTAFLEQGARLAAGNGMLVLKSSCYKQGEEFYLSPWNDIFQELYQLVAKDGEAKEEGEAGGESRREELKRNLSCFLNGSGGEEVSRMTYPMVEKLALDLLEFLTEKSRILLVFDDIQWMDSMSCQLLNRLLHLLGREKLLLLCSMSREEEARAMGALEPVLLRDGVEILRLSPFTREETDELIRKYLPELSGEEEKKAEIYRATDGNAFFLKELLNLIREKGYTLEKSRRTNYVIQARLSGLSARERDVLGAMSVFPEKAGVEELELLLPDTDRLSLLRVLESLQERFLIREVLVGWNVHYQFVHRVFQEYVCERQSNGKRMLYHQMLAACYEEAAAQNRRAALLPLVIYHYEHCHNQIKACQYRIEWLKEYYTLINENFPVLHWSLSDLDESLRVTPPADEMIRLAGELVGLEGNTEEIRRMKLEMNYIRGRYDIAHGNYSQGLSHIEEGIRLSRELSDQRMLLSCYKQQIFYGIQVEDLERVETYTEIGLSLAAEGLDREERLSAEQWIEQGPSDTGQSPEDVSPGKGGMPGWAKGTGTEEKRRRECLEEFGTFLRLRGWYNLHTGQYGRAERALRLAGAVFEGLGNEYGAGQAACLNYIGDVYRLKGQPDRAVSFYKEAIGLVEKEPVIIGLGQFYANTGQALYQSGDKEGAEQYLKMAASYLRKNGCIWGLERVEACLALLFLEQGDPERAKEHYRTGRELSDKIRNPQTRKILETVGLRLKEEEKKTEGKEGKKTAL
ncbi:dNA-binding transcriptional activator of the SARP family [Clostridium sp. CAG:149]|nr:dNA-binding transcriptional activator of the SARP family [Clostridium sp. CAG:149]